MGNDTASFARSSVGVTVDLSTGTVSGGDANGDSLVSIERVNGSWYGDQLVGDVSDNTFLGDGGDDTIDGLGGVDTAVFAGAAADYFVTRNGDGTVTVTDLDPNSDMSEGADHLSNFETLSRYVPPRPLEEIDAELKTLEAEIAGLLRQVVT